MEKIKTIFFSGGGTRGIAFIGALKALNEHNMLDHFVIYSKFIIYEIKNILTKDKQHDRAKKL